MHLVKTSVTIPEDLLSEAKKLSRYVSALVTEALRDYLRRLKAEKALESFGSWEARDESSIDLVNRMRSEGAQDYVGRDC
jgi:post-segregation antitoxin (ccd killing protein)